MPPVSANGNWQEESRTVVQGLLGALEAGPDAGRLLLVEALAGGSRVRAERDQVLAMFEGRAQEIIEALGRRTEGPRPPGGVLLGGVRSIVSEAFAPTRGPMLALVDDMLAWLESYGVPAGEQGWSSGPHALLPTRVAEQWLAAATPALPLEKLPRGRHRLPAAAVDRSQRTRIIHGTSEVVVAKGYAAATVADIVAAAGISRDVFYEHFSNKHEAFLAAQHTARRRCSRPAQPRTSPDRLAGARLARAAGTGAGDGRATRGSRTCGSWSATRPAPRRSSRPRSSSASP